MEEENEETGIENEVRQSRRESKGHREGRSPEAGKV